MSMSGCDMEKYLISVLLSGIQVFILLGFIISICSCKKDSEIQGNPNKGHNSAFIQKAVILLSNQTK